MSYIGQNLPSNSFVGYTTDTFAGDGSATTFTMSKAPFNESAVIVVINNVVQQPTADFTVSGTTLTIDAAVADGDVIYATHTGGAIPINTASGLDTITTIGSGAAEDTKIVFDGNAQDFYIGLDDSADDLIIGLGSAVGTTPIISVDENKLTTVANGLTLTDGDVTVASGHGISFAATANSSVGANISEKLTDYEQGTWDIGLSSATGGAITVNSTYDLGTYQLINDICYIKGYIIATAFPSSNSGNITITGLPFPVQNNAGYYSPLAIPYANGFSITAGRPPGGYFVINSSTVAMQMFDATTGVSHLQASELTSDGAFMFFGSYTIGG